ncbi:MAG: CDP-alcohol phosphatidyltransferase family protein [Candidatus Nanopelagicaceae bacterium]
MTIPNLLTITRAIGIPIFLFYIFNERYTWAVVILMIGGATDYLDGKLARALNQESRLGELLDPAVDRLYIASVLAAMYFSDLLPIWLLILIVARDIALGVLLLLLKYAGKPALEVTYLGKAATFNLLYALPLLLLTKTSDTFAEISFILGWAFAGWGIGLYLVTGIHYGATGLRRLRKV